jgi:DNA-binding MarR family transcriptional regulator
MRYTAGGIEAIRVFLAEVGALANQLRKGVDDTGSVRLGDLSILEVLDGGGPLTVPEIARVRATSRQNIQMLVNRLEAEGCVELAGNPAHQRSALVRITERGRALLGAAREGEARSLEKLRSEISEADLASATATLQRVRNLLSADEAKAATVRRVKPALKLEAWRTRKDGTRQIPVPRPVEEVVVAAAPATKEEQALDEEDFPVNLL